MSRAAGIQLALVAATLAVYGHVVAFPLVRLDDYQYLVDVPHVGEGLTWKGVFWAFGSYEHASNWHPLNWLSYMLDVQLFGNHAGGHHATNILLHIVNTLLVFQVLRGMTHRDARSGHRGH